MFFSNLTHGSIDFPHRFRFPVPRSSLHFLQTLHTCRDWCLHQEFFKRKRTLSYSCQTYLLPVNHYVKNFQCLRRFLLNISNVPSVWEQWFHGGISHTKRTGVLVGNFKNTPAIFRAWLEMFHPYLAYGSSARSTRGTQKLSCPSETTR